MSSSEKRGGTNSSTPSFFDICRSDPGVERLLGKQRLPLSQPRLQRLVAADVVEREAGRNELEHALLLRHLQIGTRGRALPRKTAIAAFAATSSASRSRRCRRARSGAERTRARPPSATS